MSTILAPQITEEHGWLCPDTCSCQPQEPQASAEQRERWNLIRVVHAQSEDCADGWKQVFCVDCGQCETALAGIDAFVSEIQDLGWSVDSVDRQTAVCLACASKSFEPSEEQEREDYLVFQAHKGD